MNDVHRAATVFRQAIINCPDTGLISLRDFPSGACGDTSPLLGEFLREQGYGDWEYVSGGRERDGYSHAWLEQDGLIVDITADQFPGVEDPVIVTRDRSWHEQFLYSPNPRHLARIDIYDEYTTQRLTEAYGKIMAGVPTLKEPGHREDGQAPA